MNPGDQNSDQRMKASPIRLKEMLFAQLFAAAGFSIQCPMSMVRWKAHGFPEDERKDQLVRGKDDAIIEKVKAQASEIPCNFVSAHVTRWIQVNGNDTVGRYNQNHKPRSIIQQELKLISGRQCWTTMQLCAKFRMKKNKTKLRIAQTNKKNRCRPLENPAVSVAGIKETYNSEISGRISTRPSSISADDGKVCQTLIF